jgi:hypothetical protein
VRGDDGSTVTQCRLPERLLANSRFSFFIALLFAPGALLTAAPDYGRQFVGLSRFSEFTKAVGQPPQESVWLSPEILSRIKWTELIASWNANLPKNAVLRIEARGIYPERSTKFYTLGIWSGAADDQRRMSVKSQQDENAEVSTDTLVMKVPCDRVQIRLRVSADPMIAQFPVKFLGLSFADTGCELPVLPPNRAAWGRTLAVPERTQLDYAEGEQSWCSPTSTSMMLAWWAGQTKRPELDRAVPEVAREVFDPNWPGTGNWAFNTAYAGSFEGIRAYVSRFSDVSELEDWITAGVPVAISVAYTALKGVPPREGPDGHLVVCVGFTASGDVVVNDPGTRRQMRRVVPRENLVRAWAHSRNTVYLIYPEGTKSPKDRFGHWEN